MSDQIMARVNSDFTSLQTLVADKCFPIRVGGFQKCLQHLFNPLLGEEKPTGKTIKQEAPRACIILKCLEKPETNGRFFVLSIRHGIGPNE